MKSKQALGRTDNSRTIDRMELVTQYVNFVDYEKAFDCLDRETLWKISQHYGVPMKLVNMIKNSYEGMSCRVIHDGQLTKNFEIRTGVRQGCLLSPFLFILATYWMMKTETKGKRNGIQWKILTQLDDFNFADDLGTNVSQPSANARQDNRSGPDFSPSRAENQQKENQDPET